MQLVKYSEFAHDMVLSDILSYLLFQETNKMPFLNNAEMEKVGQSLKRLINEMEKEMMAVQEEREKLQRNRSANLKPVDVDPVKCLGSVIKKSKFEKTLHSLHRKKLSLPNFQESRTSLNSKRPRYYLKRR